MSVNLPRIVLRSRVVFMATPDKDAQKMIIACMNRFKDRAQKSILDLPKRYPGKQLTTATEQQLLNDWRWRTLSM